jgi:hypothetical protein
VKGRASGALFAITVGMTPTRTPIAPEQPTTSEPAPVRDPGTMRHPGVEEPPAMVPDPKDDRRDPGREEPERREPYNRDPDEPDPAERDPEPFDAMMADDRWEVDEPFSGSFGAYRS